MTLRRLFSFAVLALFPVEGEVAKVWSEPADGFNQRRFGRVDDLRLPSRFLQRCCDPLRGTLRDVALG